MKFPRKLLKTARVMYLYADGHASVVHERRDPKAGNIEWVTLHERLPVQVLSGFSSAAAKTAGRLIINREAIPLILSAQRVHWYAPEPRHGSDKSKALGLAIGIIGLNFGSGYMHMYTIPDILCGDITIQTDTSETWSEVKEDRRWGSMNVSDVFSLPVPSASAQSARI
jgi:prepilin-type processing-associated H-X9-DG protein